jgi:DNA-binding MarR family transcriptional regulator
MTAPAATTARSRKSRPKADAAESASGTDLAIDYTLLPNLVGYRLRRAQLAVFQHFARTMQARLGRDRLSPGEFGVLSLIEANPGLSQTALAAAIGTDRSTMVPILDRLEKRALVERRAVPGDRRRHALALGEQGRKLLAKFRDAVLAHEQRITADLSPSERELLLSLLERLRGQAEQS